MAAAPHPPDDLVRVAALYATGFFGSGRDERFDRVARVAQKLLDAPISMVNMVDREEQWGKACIGLPTSDMPRGISFCQHTILEARPLVVEDTLLDPRFADNPLVTGAQGLRAYVGHPVHDPGGHRIGTLCVADRRPRAWTEEDLATLHDLAAWVDLEIGWATLREAAEREQATETRLRAIIDSAAEGIVTLDAEGRVLLANPAATDMLGHRAEDLAGRVLHDVAHHSRPDGSPYPRAECPSHQTLAHGEFHRFLEEVYWRSDGTPLPVELSSTPLLDGDRLTGAVVVFRDATERHELERMKTDFISAVSHELRTPLTSISGYLEGVLAEDDGTLNDVQREDLEIVQRNAALLEALVDDLLLLSRMQAGRLEFARAAVPLDELLAELVEDRPGRVGARPAVRRLAAPGARERRRPAPASVLHEPALERAEVRARGNRGSRVRRAKERRSGGRGHRQRPGHPRRRGRAARAAVLPRVDGEGRRRHRAGADDHARDRRPACGGPRRREPPGRGLDLPRAAPGVGGPRRLTRRILEQWPPGARSSSPTTPTTSVASWSGSSSATATT